MTIPGPTQLQSFLIGAMAWLVATALLHWLTLPIHIDTRFTFKMAALAFGNCSFFAAMVYLLVQRKPVAERFPSAAAMVMPVAFGDAVAMAFFKDFFPKIDPNASGMFAALLLLTSAVILVTGFVAGARVVKG